MTTNTITFPFGEPPRDDVDAAAALLVRYKAAKLVDRAFIEMFAMMVADPGAVARRAEQIEAERAA